MAELTGPDPAALEALQQRHRKEQRDLVSRITQKKKQATKKTRKGVNDECERLERALRETQEDEVRALTGSGGDAGEDEDAASEPDAQDSIADAPLEALSLSSNSPTESAREAAAPAPSDPGKKRNRQKERLARRKADQDAAAAAAEEEARNAPDPRALEQQRFEPLLARNNLALHEIRADGHCLYAAVADQLATRALPLSPSHPAADVLPYKQVRLAAAGWIETHAPDFEPFLEDPLPEHVRRIRETGEWGGHLELLALARSYGVRICVLHGDGRVDRIGDEDGEGGTEKEKEMQEIWLGYYRHSHGLGEHYNSLRKAEG